MARRSTHSPAPLPTSLSLSFSRRNCLPVMIALWFSVHAVQAQTNIHIGLTQQWTPTGISVTRGESLIIHASGSMNWYTGGCPSPGSCTVDPNGVAWVYCGSITPGILAPGLSCWSLIGRIGGG